MYKNLSKANDIIKEHPSYKNLVKIVNVIDAIESLNEVDYMISVLTSFDTNSEYSRSSRSMVIKTNGKEVEINDGPLFKIFKYCRMVQNYDDFCGYLDIIKCYLNFFENKFNFLDLSNEVDEIINIRKQYKVYNPEIDDEYVQYIKIYFEAIHMLLKELDNLKE